MKALKLMKLVITHPFQILKYGLRTYKEDDFRNYVQKKYGISQLPTIDMLDLVPGLNENLNTYSFLEGTSLVTDLVLLKQFARTYPKCNYLEIGSWRGESIKNVSEIADRCTSLTLSPSEMKQMNLGQKFIDVHGAFSKNTGNITEILHNSATYDFSKFKEKFDLIFVDGDHSYEGVLIDTKNIFNLRKDASSVIVWHDYGFGTEVVRHSVLAALLDGIPKKLHKNLYHVSNTMCAVYIENKTFKTSDTIFPTYPNKSFQINLKAVKL
jgi:hypothetical protein